MSEGKRKLYTKKRENSRETARGAAKEAHKSKTEYTAKYTVQRSDTLLDFLLKKCNQSRNNVKSLLSGGKRQSGKTIRFSAGERRRNPHFESPHDKRRGGVFPRCRREGKREKPFENFCGGAPRKAAFAENYFRKRTVSGAG